MSYSKKIALCVAVLLIAVITVGVSAQANIRKANGASGVPATLTPASNGGTRAIGTITYDNNVPFQRDALVNGTIGNRFTPTTDPHTVTSVSFRLAGNYGVSVVASIWQPGATSANLLRRWLITGVPATTVTGTVVVAPVANRVGTTTSIAPITNHSGSFIAGLKNTAYTGLSCGPPATALNSTCDGVAVTSGALARGTANHGVRLQLAASGFIPTTTTVPNSDVSQVSANAIFRVTGDNLPVELMSFGIDEN